MASKHFSGRIRYVELAKAKVSSTRNVVISGCSAGGFTVAQQLVADEGSKSTAVFLKGAIHVDDAQGLYELRDALNIALAKAESGSVVEETVWDE